MSVQLERQVRRMPSTKGYRSYHGRGGAGRIVLIVLLCLILLAAVGFLVLQRYAVYGSDGSIRFDHVYFKYHDTEESWNLEDVSFTVPSGATVGILGGTGSAKTTLVSMIPRLYDVNGGAVYVGGHNVKDMV